MLLPQDHKKNQGCLLYIFNMVFKVRATALRQEKETYSIQIGKKVEKLLFADNIIIYIENHKNPTKEFLELIKS